MPSFADPQLAEARVYLLLWGESGCGKTTLAATAPGLKAWLQFDPNGTTSIAHRNDYKLLDLSGATPTVTMIEFSKTDPFGMKTYLKANPDVQTVVVDSITALAQTALMYAVTRAGGNATADVPGRNGWGVRNNIMRRVIAVILQICVECRVNLIVIAHEGAPDKTEDGVTTGVTISLSNSIASDVSLRFNEVWYMRDSGNTRTIYLRPWGVVRPMKSRMFITQGAVSSFVWNYDADAQAGEGITDWWQAWNDNGGRKIALPKGGVKK